MMKSNPVFFFIISVLIILVVGIIRRVEEKGLRMA